MSRLKSVQVIPFILGIVVLILTSVGAVRSIVVNNDDGSSRTFVPASPVDSVSSLTVVGGDGKSIAVVPEAASSLLLPARIGHARAYAMFALGEALDGRTAAAIGLANAALPRSEVQPRALEAARALAARPAEALAATKRLMRDAEAITAVMAREGKLFSERLRSAEAAEGLASFREKRSPKWYPAG